jgi:transposase-like protein
MKAFSHFFGSLLSGFFFLLMLGAVGVDAEGRKHPLGVVEGATENAATVQVLHAR